LGGGSEVLSLRRRGEKTVSDERILGSGEFIEQLLLEAEEKAKETLGWRGRVPSLQALLWKISKRDGVEEEEVRGGDRKRSVVGVRKLFCQIAVRRLGYSGGAVARFLGVTTSLVNRYASSGDVGNLDQHL
jgi:putative transposase